MSDIRLLGGGRRGRNKARTRDEVLPSILMDSDGGQPALPSILESSSARSRNLVEVSSQTHSRNGRGQSLEQSMTYTQLERDIKGDSDALRPELTNLEKEQYGSHVELVGILQEYFAQVDARAPKHFINACLNLLESQGLQAVNRFLLAKYGVEPFPKKEEDTKSSRATVTLSKSTIFEKARNIISEKLSGAKNEGQLKQQLQSLYKLRKDLATEDENKVIEAICHWAFRYGVYFLAGKLEIFYLGSVESENQTMVEVLQTLPDVPYHDSKANKAFNTQFVQALAPISIKPTKSIPTPPKEKPSLKAIKISSDSKIRKVENSRKKKAQTVYVDEDTSLDKDEVAFLWLNVYKFYQENHYARGLDYELVKQTENSVYYILQHGIEGFNKKVYDKFGRRFTNLVFVLPQRNEWDTGTLEKVMALYSKANESMKAEAAKRGKKASKREFSKLIEALNFKFSSSQKKKGPKKTSQNFMQSLRIAKSPTSIKFKKPNKKKRRGTTEELLKKKIKLFVLQSMKTPLDKIDGETKVLLALYKAKGSRAFKTRMKINYGGNFEQVDFMSEEEIDALLNKIQHTGSDPVPNEEIAKRHNSAQFMNIYKELSFYRNPETQLRYNKV